LVARRGVRTWIRRTSRPTVSRVGRRGRCSLRRWARARWRTVGSNIWTTTTCPY